MQQDDLAKKILNTQIFFFLGGRAPNLSSQIIGLADCRATLLLMFVWRCQEFLWGKGEVPSLKDLTDGLETSIKKLH